MQHKVVCKLADFSTLYHSFVNVVDGRLMRVLIVIEDGFDISPSNLLVHSAAVLDVEYHLFD